VSGDVDTLFTKLEEAAGGAAVGHRGEQRSGVRFRHDLQHRT
jgi:hypothetical protein